MSESTPTLSRFKPYLEMKYCDVDWLGEIPSHWTLTRLKHLLRLSKERNNSEPVGDMLSVSGYRGIEVKKYDFEEQRRTSEDLEDYRVVQKGQLVVNTMWLNYSGLGVSEIEGYVSPAYRCYYLSSLIDKRYLHHLVRSHRYVGRYCSLLYGIRPNSLQVSSDDFESLELLLPPFSEQGIIANFLDNETEKIDELISKRVRMIELLQEKRLSLINHTVTKGLSPQTSMKDSGIEWLGDIPAHWKLLNLKYAVTFRRGHDLPDYERREGSIPVVSSGGISGFHDEFRATGPGLVTGRYGTIGLFYYIEEDYWPLNTTLYCINNRGNHVKFLMYLLQNIADVFLANSYKSAVPGVDRNDLHTLVVALPDDIEEQSKISEYLDCQDTMLKDTENRIRKAITLLQEYKTALITAAVTGQIDVRGEVA